jgi:hypothetical protein
MISSEKDLYKKTLQDFGVQVEKFHKDLSNYQKILVGNTTWIKTVQIIVVWVVIFGMFFMGLSSIIWLPRFKNIIPVYRNNYLAMTTFFQFILALITNFFAVFSVLVSIFVVNGCYAGH